MLNQVVSKSLTRPVPRAACARRHSLMDDWRAYLTESCAQVVPFTSHHFVMSPATSNRTRSGHEEHGTFSPVDVRPRAERTIRGERSTEVWQANAPLVLHRGLIRTVFGAIAGRGAHRRTLPPPMPRVAPAAH